MENYGNIPVFDGEEGSDGEGYEMWSRKMKTLFQSQDLWDVVQHGYKEGSSETGSETLSVVKKMKDLKALYLIQQGVSSYIFPFIAKAKTSKEAWEAIKNAVDDYYDDDDDDDLDELDDDDNDNDNDDHDQDHDDNQQTIIDDGKLGQSNLISEDHEAGPSRVNLIEDHVTEPPRDNLKDHVTIRMERLLEKLKLKFTTEKRCIFKLPDQLCRGNEEFYEPKVVAIGPNLLRDKPQFASMEKLKMCYLKRLLERTAAAGSEVPKVSLESLVKAVKSEVERVKTCYGGSTESTLPDDHDNLVQMLVLDGCFIIELLRDFENKPKLFRRMSVKTNDNYFFRYVRRQKLMSHKTWMDSVDILYITAFQNDLLLIDNQIPFFIIKTLYNVINNSNNGLKNLISKFLHLKYGMPESLPLISMDEFKDDNCHLLYIAHKTLCAKREEMVKKLKLDGESSCLINSARKLEEANVKLMANTMSESIFDITFSEGRLIIPCFDIDDQFEIEIRNFIALELSQSEGNRYYCDYVVFMDHLIASSDDVDLLIHRGIITNHMIDANFVNTMFMNLTKKVVRSNPYTYSDISTELNKYYKSKQNTFWPSFKHKYLKSPLTFIAIVAASMLFLFTFTQTVFTIIK